MEIDRAWVTEYFQYLVDFNAEICQSVTSRFTYNKEKGEKGLNKEERVPKIVTVYVFHSKLVRNYLLHLSRGLTIGMNPSHEFTLTLINLTKPTTTWY